MKYHNYIPVLLLLLFVTLSFFVLKPLFLSLFVGALLAYLLYPLHQLMLKIVRRRTLSALILCSFVFLLLFVPGIFLIKVLVKDAYVFFLLVKQKLAVGFFSNCTNNFCKALLEVGKQDIISTQIQAASKAVTNWVIQKGSAFLFGLPRAIIAIFVMFFGMFYFLKDGELFLQWVSCLFGKHKKKYDYLLTRLGEMVHGIVHGYLLIALLQGSSGALGFFLFGVPSPLLWGIVMAFLALIPSLGTGLVWGPAALIFFLDGLFQDSQSQMLKGIGLFLYGLIFIGSIDNFIRPKFIGKKAKIHPALIFFGILGGIVFFGFWGFIIGPLILSMTQVLIDVYVHRKIEVE